jgi:hypothetical protein
MIPLNNTRRSGPYRDLIRDGVAGGHHREHEVTGVEEQ